MTVYVFLCIKCSVPGRDRAFFYKEKMLKPLLEEYAWQSDARVEVKVGGASFHQTVKPCQKGLEHIRVALEETLGTCLECSAFYLYINGPAARSGAEDLGSIRGEEVGAAFYG